MDDNIDAKKVLSVLPIASWKRPSICPRITRLTSVQNDHQYVPVSQGSHLYRMTINMSPYHKAHICTEWPEIAEPRTAQNCSLWRLLIMFGAMHSISASQQGWGWWCMQLNFNRITSGNACEVIIFSIFYRKTSYSPFIWVMMKHFFLIYRHQQARSIYYSSTVYFFSWTLK